MCVAGGGARLVVGVVLRALGCLCGERSLLGTLLLTPIPQSCFGARETDEPIAVEGTEGEGEDGGLLFKA